MLYKVTLLYNFLLKLVHIKYHEITEKKKQKLYLFKVLTLILILTKFSGGEGREGNGQCLIVTQNEMKIM